MGEPQTGNGNGKTRAPHHPASLSDEGASGALPDAAAARGARFAERGFPDAPARGTPPPVSSATATAPEAIARSAAASRRARHPLPAEHPGLSPAARAEVRAFAEAFFSSDGTPPPRARLDWFVADLADLLGHAGARARFVIRACLLTITWLVPLFLMGRPGRFGSMSLADRIEALERTERSPAALAFFAVRAVTSLVYYEHPDAAREIGWDQDCMGVTPKRLPVLTATDDEDETRSARDEEE